MNKDLFLAILSLDSYNRGYAKGVVVSGAKTGVDLAEPGRRLGNAEITAQAISPAAIAAGFYALAYDLTSAGIDGLTGTVIAYRGSDYEDTGGAGSNIFTGGNDVWKGWSAARGFPGGSQPTLALEFYKAVTRRDPYNTPGTSTITGHSLGGELAGYVSALSGNSAVLFDNLPFGFAAVVQSLAVKGLR